MKCFSAKWMMPAFILMVFGVSSCSDNDNPKTTPKEETIENDLSQFTLPAYADESVKINLNGNPAGIQSVELTESGEYIITYGYNYSNYAASANEEVYLTDNKGKSHSKIVNMLEKVMPARQKHTGATRYGDGYGYGSFIKVAEGEYILNGYGSITISGSSDGAMEVIMNPQDGESFTVGGQKEKTYSLDDKATLALCRSWSASRFHVRYLINGDVASDQEGPYSDYHNILQKVSKDLYNYFYNKYGAYFDEDDDDDFEEDDFDDFLDDYSSAYPINVVFTRSGSYLVEFSNDMLDVRQWKWTDINAQKILFSYYLDSDLDYTGQRSEFTFNGNQSIAHTVNSETDEDFGMISVHVWETFTEKY